MNKINVQSHLKYDRPSISKAQAFECDGCALLGFPLCHRFRKEAYGVDPGVDTRRIKRGKTLVDQDEFPQFFGVLRRGYVRQERLRLHGDRVLFGLACPGDIVRGLPDSPATYTSEAATDIDVCTMDHVGVAHLMLESLRFRQVILHHANRLHERLLGSAWRLNALDSRERIIAFLVDATGFMPTETLPDGSLVLRIEVSRRDWADLTNTAVETISRTVRYLSEKEMVVSLTPSKFRIRDLESLAHIAGIDPPSGRWRGTCLSLRSNAHCASPALVRRMKAVHTASPKGNKDAMMKASTATQKRCDDNRNRHHVEEDIRT